jgi:hypothetical protein
MDDANDYLYVSSWFSIDMLLPITPKAIADQRLAKSGRFASWHVLH